VIFYNNLHWISFEIEKRAEEKDRKIRIIAKEG